MENAELCKKLRWIEEKDSSTFRRSICKMAAQRIDKLAAELDQTKAQLAVAVEDLRDVDINCSKCGHKEPVAACLNDEEDYPFCKGCPHDCYCKDCLDNSKWEWQGLEQKEENAMLLCGNCDHLMVCKFTDAGDGRCQQPQFFRDKHMKGR